MVRELKKVEMIKELIVICGELGIDGKAIERNKVCSKFDVKFLHTSERYTFNQLNKLNKSKLMDLRNELRMI